MPHTRSLFLAGLLLSLCAAVTLHAQEPNGPSMEKSAASITRAERNPAPLFRGIPSYTTHNVRSDFATIFVF
jgi:hypothetical protein